MQAFIYEWTNTENGIKYIGKHQGSPDDGYVGSGVVFKNSYNRHPDIFVRKILWESFNTTAEELASKEEEFLKNIADEELFYGSNRKYYNQVRNSSGFTSDGNPMKNPAKVEQMMDTRRKLGVARTPWENTIKKYGYDGAIRLKVERAIDNKYGAGNAGKPKSESHKKKIAESIQKLSDSGRMRNGGRQPLIPHTEMVSIVTELGYKGAAEKLNTSVAKVKDRYYNAVKKLKTCGFGEIGETQET